MPPTLRKLLTSYFEKAVGVETSSEFFSLTGCLEGLQGFAAQPEQEEQGSLFDHRYNSCQTPDKNYRGQAQSGRTPDKNSRVQAASAPTWSGWAG